MSVETKTLSKEISEIFWREGYTLATAESCTAGNVAAIITAIPGSSRFYKGGVIAYSDEVKKTHLYVNAETLEQHGAVSEETVVEMVKGAIKALDVDYAMATSGIAVTFLMRIRVSWNECTELSSRFSRLILISLQMPCSRPLWVRFSPLLCVSS